MGLPPEDDENWATLMNALLAAGDPDLNPNGPDAIMQEEIPKLFERSQELIARRREAPTEDLTSVLVHAEVDGETLEEHEIVMGFFLLMAAGNDSTKATYCSCHARPDGGSGGAHEAACGPGARAERGRGGAADVPRLRPLPPDGHRGHRALRLPDRQGREGRALVPELEPGRGAATSSPTASTWSATPSTRPSARAAATSAWAPRWPASS